MDLSSCLFEERALLFFQCGLTLSVPFEKAKFYCIIVVMGSLAAQNIGQSFKHNYTNWEVSKQRQLQKVRKTHLTHSVFSASLHKMFFLSLPHIP